MAELVTALGAVSQPIRAQCISVRRCASGAAAVEFAVVMPIFLLFLAGILAYGMYFGAAHSVQQLAADAARASISGITDAERSQLAKAHVAANAASYALVTAAKTTVSAGAVPGDPSQFKVEVSADTADLPIWILSGLLPLPPKVLIRASVIKRGGY